MSGSVARITSETGSRRSRATSSTILSSEGPTPSIGDGAHLPARELARLVHGIVDRGQDEVLEHRDIGRVDDLGLERDRLHFLVTGRHHLHHAAASCPGHGLVAQVLLDLRHLGLHLLELLEHLELLTHQPLPRGVTRKLVASNRFIASFTSGSSAIEPEARAGAGAALTPFFSSATSSTRASGPKTSRTAVSSVSRFFGPFISSAWAG